MNIFVLNNDPVIAAQESCDKHVVKMILETGQMLSTAHRVLDGELYYDMSKGDRPRKIKRWRLDGIREDMLWKASFVGHPCTQWCMESHLNYNWLCTHGVALCEEYTYRYGKTHKAEKLLRYLEEEFPVNIPIRNQTPFAQAMPEQYKNECAVQAYRNYYHGEKAYFAKWTNRDFPNWWCPKEILVTS